MVLYEPWQTVQQPLVKTWQGIGRVIFQLANVDPGFNNGSVSPDIGATQIRDPQQLNVLLCHEYQKFSQSGAAGVIPDNLRSAIYEHKEHMIIVI